MSTGFIYVLANSSMPGIVKVGKTTRSPSDRAAELSGVTGVATPFIVVFDQEVADCDFVERFVHTRLSGLGTRISGDREFFSAPVSHVIKAILEAITVCPASVEPEENGPFSDDGEELAELQFEMLRSPPWATVLAAADEHYYGLGDCIQDYGEAKRLYGDAARLGSAEAYLQLGNIYRLGEGGREDQDKALAYFKEGAKLGCYLAWNSMARMFLRVHRFENASKCFGKFIEAGEADSWNQDRYEDEYLKEMFWTLLRSDDYSNEISARLVALAARYTPGLTAILRSHAEEEQAKAFSSDKRGPILALAKLLDIPNFEMPLQARKR